MGGAWSLLACPSCRAGCWYCVPPAVFLMHRVLTHVLLGTELLLWTFLVGGPPWHGAQWRSAHVWSGTPGPFSSPALSLILSRPRSHFIPFLFLWSSPPLLPLYLEQPGISRASLSSPEQLNFALDFCLKPLSLVRAINIRVTSCWLRPGLSWETPQSDG